MTDARDIERLKAEFHDRVANPNDYHVLMASWCFSNAPKLFDEITSLRKQLEQAREALRRIATALSCGCNPCTSSCRSNEALQCEIETLQDIAIAALASIGENATTRHRNTAAAPVGDLPSRLMGWAGKARRSGRDTITLNLETVSRIIAGLTSAPSPDDADH